MIDKEYFDDYYVGEKVITPTRTITETDVVLFAALTGDWHPLHTDLEYAKKTAFKGRIAHGLLTLAIGTGLDLRLGPYVKVPKSFVALLGLDKVRFLAPVRIGDTIREEIEVIDMKSKDEKNGTIKTRIVIRNQDNREVLTLESEILAGKRPKPSEDGS